MSPRISFSNDFVDTQRIISHERTSRDHQTPPASSDFEFSVTNYSMMAADELFFKGRLLPFKDNNCTNKLQKMTLRDELLTDDHNDIGTASQRPPKSPIRWKELLGLKRNRGNVSSKKASKSDGSMEKVVEGKGSKLGHEEVHDSKNPQEVVSDGGFSFRDVDA
ncbi:hypothetical protein BVC80_8983g28 [Macleaya cordata]|uniref:Uncharacterized protein n=1 Tax=Macleaya cordata TaxID=56857 RepID=A0A200QIZ6_MACCD|nr:hypothetical protein BVC80_8983g28 [Macleaya cordata]